MAIFHPINRDTDYLFPQSVQDWLPENHLARYVAQVVESLDLSEIELGQHRQKMGKIR